MRYLNKIVFINSAHIRYEEVMLDGNVHFIGTQGVGKSTVLRALLFFYNANKQHLGIQPGQKSFDEFYFEKSNSYIVYEVMRETGAYTILVNRFQGKATYFFIDAPYDRNWIVEGNGNVISEWITIRNRIGKDIDVTGRIDTYEEYRNIIFGNTHDSKHRFEKFAIAESSKYQNIPRSIQNVFLNSKLDAEFVKNTIIQSITENTDDERGINLVTYRHLLEDFDSEFYDISLWFEKDKDGNCPLRQQADRVVEIYRHIVALEREMKMLWHKLNYAEKTSKQMLPKLESEKGKIQERISILKKQLSDIDEKYYSEQTKLSKELGVVESRLKEISSKRKKYEELNITQVLKLASQEGSLIAEKTRLETIKASLLKEYENITEKYKRLFEELDRSKKEYEQNKHQIVSDKRDELQNIQAGLRSEEKELLRQIDEKYSMLLKESDERLNNIHNDKSRCDGNLRDLKNWHPKEKETNALREEISILKNSESELKARLDAKINEIEILRTKCQKEQNDIEYEYKQKEVEKQHQLDKFSQDLMRVEDLLSRLDGSLYQWLEANKSGWQETIGKVIDEDKVLYSVGLNPKMDSDSSDSMYGLRLDLDKIESTHRTPDEYKIIKADIEDKISQLKLAMASDVQDKERIMAEKSKCFSLKTTELRQEKTELEIQITQLPQKKHSLETQLFKLENEESEIIEKERVVRQEAFDAIELKLQKETEGREKMNASKQREQKAVSRDIAGKEAIAKKNFEELKRKTDNEIANNADAVEQQRLAYSNEQENILKGKGADTAIIARNQQEINVVDDSLKQIKEQKELVYNYHKDERELFNNEESYSIEKKTIETKLSGLLQKYKDTKSKKEHEKDEEQKTLSQIISQYNQLTEGLKEAEFYCQNENDLPISLMDDLNEVETQDSCQVIVSSLRSNVNKIRNKKEEQKKSVNQFISRFSAKNTFNFKQGLMYDDDYREFSMNLQEFLDNDMIEEYRRRTNEHYDEILRRVAKEVGYVMKDTSKIKEIISDINRDFKERNFAGVIKSIELRPEDTSDRLMQMLQSIKLFTDENLFSMGEINLFSGDNRDDVNAKVIDLLAKLMKQLQKESTRQFIGLADTFRLQFRVRENDNDTNWVERISNVGSDGTDILVKAMINIMLINVFKERVSRKFGEFKVHCMMDEIGKLHPNNIKGILQFANSRNILLINSSPTTNNPYDYKYTYTLSKDAMSQTRIILTLKKNDDENI